MEIKFFETSSGRLPVLEFIDALTIQDQATLLGSLKSAEDLGFNSNRVQFRQIQGKLWEMKVSLKSGGYRLFYVMVKNNNLILLHAYKKQSQKTPKKEIEKAEKRMKEVIKNEAFYK